MVKPVMMLMKRQGSSFHVVSHETANFAVENHHKDERGLFVLPLSAINSASIRTEICVSCVKRWSAL